MKKKAVRAKKSVNETTIYTLNVEILAGRLSMAFVDKNPVIARVMLILGDQTLEDLHEGIFDAFKRFDPHMYEFQFGKKPMDRNAVRYVIPGADVWEPDEDASVGGYVNEVTMDSLQLKVKQSFFYWFDFGDDWWHRITVQAIEQKSPRGRFPRVIGRTGRNPPQYPNEY